EAIGSHTKAKVVKNKVAPPFKTAEFDILYGKGISKMGELVDLAVSFNIIQKSGAWFSYGDQRLAQGRDNVRTLLEKDAALAAEIEEKVMTEWRRRMAEKKGAAEEAEPLSAPAAPAGMEPPAPAPKVRSRVNLDVDVDD
ncbi:MAG: DNA recombination/repair protein RecA, partial [Clostridia bacterium]|nr:DNA recombination/repair protein RecA [Clostridia bacterium]